MKLQLFVDGSEILGSDGIMYVDGRFNMCSIVLAVKERNKRMVNFPPKVCDSFAMYNGRTIGTIITLNNN